MVCTLAQSVRNRCSSSYGESQCALLHISLCSDLFSCRPRAGSEPHSRASGVEGCALSLCGSSVGRLVNPMSTSKPQGVKKRLRSSIPFWVCSLLFPDHINRNTSRYRWTRPARWYSFGQDAFDHKWTHPSSSARYRPSGQARYRLTWQNTPSGPRKGLRHSSPSPLSLPCSFAPRNQETNQHTNTPTSQQAKKPKN